MDLDVSRHFTLQYHQAFFYSIYDIDGICTGLLLDDHHHPWYAIAPTPLSVFFIIVLHLSYVF